MSPSQKIVAFAVASMVVAVGIFASEALQASGQTVEVGPAYTIEGAWYGITDIPGVPPTPTLDTFTSNARRPGVQGTFLCTIPSEIAQLIGGQTPSGQGNWVRTGTNSYAFTAVRAMMSGPAHVGWARTWGTITAVSDDRLTGTINAQFFAPDWTPVSPQFAGTLERRRVEVKLEQ